MKKKNTSRPERIPDSEKELQMLYSVSRVLDASLDLREVAGPVLEALANFLNMNYGTLTLLHRKTGDILIEAAHGLSAQQARQGRYKLGEGVTGQVIMSGEPAIIPRKSESPLLLDRTRRGKDPGTSFVCVPIKMGKTVVGALSVDTPYKSRAELDDDARLLSVVCSMIAQAVKLRNDVQEEQERLAEENARLKSELRERFRPSNIIGNSHEMQIVYDQIAQVSKSNVSVLIQGETGTGKELVAHAIHYNSARADKPFIRTHCAALPESIIESELFGHVKGAFTGAVADRKGRFELADGGTLFLDEIGEIPPAIQIKLLRAIQEHEFERIGDSRTQKVNVRLIAATNRNLQDMVAQGRFREDLFYRLYVFPLFVPPLRKRKADIAMLAEHFLRKCAAEQNKNVSRLSGEAMARLTAYHWPGNVRELENCMERAVLLAGDDTIRLCHLPPTLQPPSDASSVPAAGGGLAAQTAAFEKGVLIEALRSSRGNLAAAARLSQTTQRIMAYKIRNHGLDPGDYK